MSDEVEDDDLELDEDSAEGADGFSLSVPDETWVLRHADKPYTLSVGDQILLPIFTDEAACDAFYEATVVDATVVPEPMPSHEALKKYLNKIPARAEANGGVDSVVFDPRTSDPPAQSMMPFDEFRFVL